MDIDTDTSVYCINNPSNRYNTTTANNNNDLGYEPRLGFLNQTYFRAPDSDIDYPIMVLITDNVMDEKTEAYLLDYLSN